MTRRPAKPARQLGRPRSATPAGPFDLEAAMRRVGRPPEKVRQSIFYHNFGPEYYDAVLVDDEHPQEAK